MKEIKKWIPLLIIELYLTITLLLFLSQTIEYPSTGKSKILFFVLGYQLCFAVGYYFSAKKKYKKNEFTFSFSNVKRYFALFLIITLCISLISIVRIANSFNPVEIIFRVGKGLIDPGENYYFNLGLTESELWGGRVFTSLNTLLSPVVFFTYTVGIYFFNDLKIHNKLLLIVAIILEFLSYVIRGTNIGIFRISIIIISTIALLLQKRVIKINKRALLIVIFVSCFAGSYFLYSISSRLYDKGSMPETLNNYKINYDAIPLRVLPDNLKFIGVVAINYLSNGYQGMEYALNEDFTTTYGFGNSDFLTQNIQEITGINIFERTYVYKINEKWSYRKLWHTAYTWWANDISFYGVFLLMIILGWVVYFLLRDAIYGNIFAVILLPLYSLLVLFIPANNVVLSNPLTCVPFVTFNFLWFISKIIGSRHFVRR